MDTWIRTFIKSLFPYEALRIDIEKAFLAKHPNVPKKLYKYRSFCENHIDALKKDTLYMSAPERFNDPYDSAVFFDSARFFVEDISAEEFIRNSEIKYADIRGGKPYKPSPLRRPIRADQWYDKIIEEKLRGAPESVRRALGSAVRDLMVTQSAEGAKRFSAAIQKGYSVLSLSANPLSETMWAYYSDNHRGFCIEYNFEAINADDLIKRVCFPVLYTKKMRDATRYMHGRKQDFNNLFGILMSLMKKADWRHEEEWRIIFPIGPDEANRPLVMPTPSSILVGTRASARDIESLRSVPSISEVTISKMELDPRSYKMRIGAAI